MILLSQFVNITINKNLLHEVPGVGSQVTDHVSLVVILEQTLPAQLLVERKENVISSIVMSL